MKTIALLTQFTVAAAGASALGLFLDILPFALFTVALAAFLSLLLAHDYAAPVLRWEPSPAPAPVPASMERAVQPLRLAA